MVLIQDYTIKTPDVLSMLNPPKYAGLFALRLFILYRQRAALIMYGSAQGICSP
jgi:hypothetical protein